MDDKLIKSRIQSNMETIEQYKKMIVELEKENIIMEEEMIKVKKMENTIKLNEQQNEAVREIENDSIIIACPGSGKTHTLIAKVVYLINENNINPENIILITFTKKASHEMTMRLEKYIKGRLYHSGTIHGLAYRTLQKYNNINYTILDEVDTYKTIRQMISMEKVDEEERAILSKEVTIVYEQLGSYYPAEIDDIIEMNKMDEHKNELKNIFTNYEKFKIENKYLDFNDLMSKFLIFLDGDESKEFKENIKYILFDEYQDINSIQEMILKKIRHNKQIITLVGDDAQSIYAFRGSNVKYILDTSQNDKIKTFRLEMNYRSTSEIVNFCNNIISHNKNQIEKNMIAYNGINNIKPRILGFDTLDDEIKYIVKRIKDNHKIGIELNRQVIITRKNRQLDQFEIELIKNKINYVKSKGIGILDRIHVKDYLSFMIIVVNKDSIIHWKRILQTCDGIGTITADKILESNKNKLNAVIGDHGTSVNSKLKELKEILHYLTNNKKLNEIELENYSKKVINYISKKFIQKKDTMTNEEKIEDLQTLEEYLISSESISKFLEDIHLNIEIPAGNKAEESDDYLSLSTIHGSKGLEWDYVYFAGCSSENVPSIRSSIYKNELEDLEEERRLFYVGCSRAKKTLEITMSYSFHGEKNSNFTSPFINEIDDDLYDSINLKFPERLNSGDVTTIVRNYLLIKTGTPLYDYMKDLEYTYKILYINEYKSLFRRHPYEYILGTFIDNLIAKIVWINYHKIIKTFEVNEYQRQNYKKDKYYYTYIDSNNDWKDSLDAVLWITLKTNRKLNLFSKLLPWIKSNIEWFKKIEKSIINLVEENLKDDDNFIGIHYNVSYGSVMGEIDLIVNDNLIEIKTSTTTSITMRNVLQTILYRYMLIKKGLKVNKISIINPIEGDIYEFNTNGKWKNTFNIYNKMIPKKINNK
jgi:DNA helicase II / ATP-dependent DNA helicase PcrA